MTAPDIESSSAPVTPLTLDDIDDLSESVRKIVVESEDDEDTSKPTDAPRPFYIYTRAQALRLSKSPLVQCPQGMPDFKEWFGDWNEQSSTKRDSDASTSLVNGRDRRFRRDADDAENSTSRNFRTTLAQPSQMGNFRHQSTRTTERDREKGSGEDREAKDGQERLRSLSDKFDRDRLASNRLNGQPTITNGARRSEAREPTKRRNGEASEDWRRGTETVRQGRDRDTRERPRSKVRDSSRGRRDTSTSRRERDHDDKDRDRARRFDRDDRDRPIRGMDHYSPPRDRDDESRRWRDDGKRDERLTAKREREREDKDKDRDNRWQTAEDRDSRLKRVAGRDKKNADDGKDRDRRDDRDKDKEREPAWMETYIPDASGGILGGKTDGEMDSIQAWKKGMKEKEERDKAAAAKDLPSGPQPDPAGEAESMNELFKMMTKREADKKAGRDVVQDTDDPVPPLNPARSQEGGSSPLTPSSTDPRSFVSDCSLSQPASTIFSAPPLETQRSASRFFPTPLNQESVTISQKQTQSPASEYNPPQTSRLLGLSSRTSSTSGGVKPQTAVENVMGVPQHTSQPMPPHQPELGSRPSPDMQYRLRPDSALGFGRPDVIRQRDPSPFDQVPHGQYEDKELYVQQFEPQRRASGMSNVSSDGSFVDVGFVGNGSGSAVDLISGTPSGPNYSSGKGSRFAKFFDSKGGKPMLASLTSPSPTQGHRPDSQADPRTMDDIFAMLQNSASQGQRGQVNPLYMLSQQGSSFGQSQPVQQHHLPPNTRLDALYDSRFEDKSFVPDGMVPGLRSTVPPPNRVRDVGGLNYLPEHLDEQFGANRAPVQHRGDVYGNSAQQIYSQGQQQPNYLRNGPLQQVPFRGNPSPISSQNPLQALPQAQRLPHGLANLGNRPPHDSNQFFGNGIQQLQNHQNVLHTHSNGLTQPQANYPNLQSIGGGGPQIRLGPGQQQHHQGLVGHNVLGGHSGGLDVRSGVTQAQQQLIGGLQGVGGYGGQGQLSHAQLQAQLLRQQQQRQQLLSQGMVPHIAHLQQAGGVHGHNQPAQDLMALLMGNGGIHRE